MRRRLAQVLCRTVHFRACLLDLGRALPPIPAVSSRLYSCPLLSPFLTLSPCRHPTNSTFSSAGSPFACSTAPSVQSPSCVPPQRVQRSRLILGIVHGLRRGTERLDGPPPALAHPGRRSPPVHTARLQVLLRRRARISLAAHRVRWSPPPLRTLSTPSLTRLELSALVTSLLLCNLLQATSGLFQSHWAHIGQVHTGVPCTAQGECHALDPCSRHALTAARSGPHPLWRRRRVAVQHACRRAHVYDRMPAQVLVESRAVPPHRPRVAIGARDRCARPVPMQPAC